MESLLHNYDIIINESKHLLVTKKMVDITRDNNENKKHLEYMDNWVRGWNGSEGWLNFGIKYSNAWNETLITSDILKKLEKTINKNIIMAGFSLLKSGNKIAPHRDEEHLHVEKNVFHLGLDVPEKCMLCVSEVNNNGEMVLNKINEENGKIISFDDGNIHFAVNDSNRDRMILYIKIDEQIVME
jgi:aspartyl/asparaginyl beta-hydroxylase (cupin superfamily)